MSCIFANDNNVEIKLPNVTRSNAFRTRTNHEVIFRQINTFLIQNNIIDPTKNIIDLGAWIGDNTIPWAINIKSEGGTIYAIDPSTENCEFIKSVADLNNLTNVTVITSAVGDGITQNLSTSHDLYHCTFMTGDDYITDGIHTFKAVSLDELYDSKIISNIGYIHLDVEGMEHLVINGADRLINTFLPVITFEQHINSDDYMSICKKLHNKGYEVYMIIEVLPGCRPDCRNFLALPPTKEKYDLELINHHLSPILF
jgi:FkbM family methyltransferase